MVAMAGSTMMGACAARPAAFVAVGPRHTPAAAAATALAPCRCEHSQRQLQQRGGRRQLAVLAAKKGGGGGGKKGGGGQKKQAGSLMNPPKLEPFLQTGVIMQNLMLVESYFRKAGRPMFGGEEIEIMEVAKALWDAPFAVLMHDIEEGQPNKFSYGNKRALDLFECTWDELIGTESKQSAEDDIDVQADRDAALARAMEKGCYKNYSGWRRSFKGTRFLVKDCTLFNVEAPSGTLLGQAVTIREWEYEDGTKGGEKIGPAELAAVAAAAAALAAGPPAEEQLAAGEAAVADQAALIRRLKEEQGLVNSSEEVQEAVGKLLQLKTDLQAMQAAARSAGASPAAEAPAAAAEAPAAAVETPAAEADSA